MSESLHDIKIIVQGTPNPCARKFVVAEDVRVGGKVSFISALQCEEIPMAQRLIMMDGVDQIHLFENVITVTQDGEHAWDEMTRDIRLIIREELGHHNPAFMVPDETPDRSTLPPVIQKIEEILDRTIRPALQFDGGDLLVLGYENNILTVQYEGACSSCPSSETGTLDAIRGVLRDEFNPEIEVVPIGAPGIPT